MPLNTLYTTVCPYCSITNFFHGFTHPSALPCRGLTPGRDLWGLLGITSDKDAAASPRLHSDQQPQYYPCPLPGSDAFLELSQPRSAIAPQPHPQERPLHWVLTPPAFCLCLVRAGVALCVLVSLGTEHGPGMQKCLVHAC